MKSILKAAEELNIHRQSIYDAIGVKLRTRNKRDNCSFLINVRGNNMRVKIIAGKKFIIIL